MLLAFLCAPLTITIPLLIHLLTSPTLSTPLSSHRVHESRTLHSESSGFRTLTRRRLPPTSPLPHPLRIYLKQPNIHLLPSLLLSVSDPTSRSYGAHWTPAQIAETFDPPEEAVGAVRAWLEGAGVDSERVGVRRSRGGDAGGVWVEVRDAVVEKVEGLLGAEYFAYRRDTDEGGIEHVSCDSYSLPRDISEIVDFITPTVEMSPLGMPVNLKERVESRTTTFEGHLAKRASSSPAGCDTLVTPECLKSLYNMTYVPQATDRNSLGIVNYYSNIYLQSDLDTFFANFSPTLVGKSPQLVSIDGGSLDQDANTDGGEAGWILQYAMTLVQPQPVELLQIGNSQIPEFRTSNELLDAIDASYCTSQSGDDLTYDPTLPNPLPGGFASHSCGSIPKTRVPYVLSNSQADHEYRFSQFYLERQCAEFAKLGLMGVTVLYAAGNTGVSGAQSGYCLDENGSMNPNATHFNPAWPAACPWVTAVGGTQLIPGAEAVPDHGAEAVWNQEIIPGFFESSGGGFSNRFPTPEYQKLVVDAFVGRLRENDPAQLRLFNTKGRAYPDLSANANAFLNVDNGSIIVSSGTSGAVPTVASIITLVNDARLANGKKPVGFINPTIYSPAFADAFTDIIIGTSQGCRGLQGERSGGFQADKGWDPATGLGSPNLGKLIEKWLTLP